MKELTKDWFLKYISNSYKSVPEKQTTQQKVGKIAKYISSKKTYRWLINTWKCAQQCSTLEKCKSKLQWDINSHWSKWPSSKKLQVINAGEGLEKREPSCTVGWNVNLHNHYGKKCGDSLKTKNKTTVWHSNPTTRHIPWGN